MKYSSQPLKVVLLSLLGAGLVFAQPCPATPFEWEFTGSLNHLGATGPTRLLDGKVIVTSGFDGVNYVPSAELYDPTAGTWSITGSPHVARTAHSTTLLADGRVLIVGGYNGATRLASAELYDPTAGTWSITGSLETARSAHVAALLADGRVLVAGGYDGNDFLGSAELYDPATGTWSGTGALAKKRGSSSVVRLLEGTVLVVGGSGNGGFGLVGTAELYHPDSGTWSAAGTLTSDGVTGLSLTLLPDGQVLAAGGRVVACCDGDCSFGCFEYDATTVTRLYDPATGVWTVTGFLNHARSVHLATLLSNGMVLVAGGTDVGYLASAELYDPATGAWAATGSLNTARSAGAALLTSGNVLVAGGTGSAGGLTSCEVYDPGIVVVTTRVDARGTIEGQGDQASFTIRAIQGEVRPSGSISFGDLAAGITVSKARVRTLSLTSNSADLSGTGRLGDGSKVTFDISVTDNGDGSTDTFSINLSNGYSAGGALTSGDIRLQ